MYFELNRYLINVLTSVSKDKVLFTLIRSHLFLSKLQIIEFQVINVCLHNISYELG